MLYERWRHIAERFRSQLAVRDLPAGRAWTFAELQAEVDPAPEPRGPVVWAQGYGAGFVLDVLRAWRWNRLLCPLEEDQTKVADSPGDPAQPSLSDLPPGCAHLKITSATTGLPKLIAFTAEQLAADADHIVATMGLRPDWPNLGAISLAHSYGFSNLVTPLLLHGIPLILVGSALPEPLRQAASAAPALTLAGVPALWRAWHEAHAIPPQVRLAISAGAPLPLPLEADIFAQTGLKLHNFYGSSECGGIAYDDSPVPRTDSACVGQPLRGVTLARNASDCLEVRSRAVGQTYWPEPDPALADGCFRTSDLVELKDGSVFLRGRLTEQINVAGRKISPESIERVLLTHPDVRACLVFGVPAPDVERTEMIVAAVAVGPGPAAGHERFRQFLLERLPAWQVPRDWVLVDELPVNARGKLSRHEWRERYTRRRP